MFWEPLFAFEEVIMIKNRSMPFRFTDEEMEIAKGTDLPELLEHLGYSVRRAGSRYHTTSSSQSPRCFLAPPFPIEPASLGFDGNPVTKEALPPK